jgi:hypothetical protein
MFDYRVVAPLTYPEPLAYSMAPRTVPVFVGRFTNPRPPAVNGTTPDEGVILAVSKGPLTVKGTPELQ